MNNNRNNNNRRRGRGNRPQGGGGNPVNRIDSRARGNAPQMLEKYKKLAQDAQHNGDRVQAEYYLQFADHYYRVLADSRPRQEEGRPRQDDGRPRRDDRGEQRVQAGDDFYGDDEDSDRDDVQDGRFSDRSQEHRSQERAPEQRRPDRRDGAQDTARDNRRGRPDDHNGQGRNGQARYAAESGEGTDAEAGAAESNEASVRPARSDRPQRNSGPRAPRTPRAPARDEGEAMPVIDAAVLPPAFKVDAADEAGEAVRAAPRRRRVKPAGQDDDAPIIAVARVQVAIPRNQPCSLHCVESVPVLGAIGTVDRVDERFGDHCVVVVFDLWHEGTQWSARFTPSELASAWAR